MNDNILFLKEDWTAKGSCYWYNRHKLGIEIRENMIVAPTLPSCSYCYKY